MGLPEERVDLSSAIRLSVMEEDVAALEKGLDTIVGPKGVRLSGGQVQRSAAARMYVRDPELIVVWKDPEFNASQRAFYYARVLEIPTPRWTAYDAKRFGIQAPPGTPMVLQERAYTSPIWYTPAKP